MIRKLNHIKDFGLFRNFSWGTLQEFKRFNLIYGWNYSGKTTFSKVFQSLQHGVILPEFFGCQFQATLEDNSILGTHALASYSKVRVFNRAFVDENFHPKMTGAKMIVVVGAENQKLKNRLGKFEKRQTTVSNIKISLESEANNIDAELKTKATDYARIISELFGDRTYNRSHFLPEVNLLPDDCSASILSDIDKDKLVEEWRKAGDYKTLNNLKWSTDELLKNILRVRRIFKTTASYKAIERLKRNPNIEKWVHEGLPLNSKEQPCEFCGSKITQDRWTELQEHFSTAYQQLHDSIQSLIEIVSNVKCEINFHDDGIFFPDLRAEYIAARDNGKTALIGLKKQMDDLSAALEKKKSNLESIQAFEIDFSFAKQLRSSIKRCNFAITAHNNKVASAGTVREEARQKITKHYAAKYFTDECLKTRKEEIQRLKDRAAQAQSCINRISSAIAQVQNNIKAASIAANIINDRLKFLLSEDDIEAVKVSDTDFQFHRNGQQAINMSEGERTAVALSYFLAKLEEDGTNMADLIIVLDDPICSFDSNHIYAMYSIIERSLSAAKQLIILTHNADFFGLVKDWMKSRTIHQDKSFYMVSRHLNSNQEWYSNLIQLPRLLEKFKSDYLYNYHCLKIIDANPNPLLEEMCGVPNMVRKLLETYLGFRYPDSHTPQWHNKLDRLFDNDLKRGEIRKFVDDLSHSHYLHRAMEVPDYVSHCKRIIHDVLEALRAKDADHVASLDAELNP